MSAKITVGYGENGYITGDGSILYTIFFGDQASATAPSAKVVVADTTEYATRLVDAGVFLFWLQQC